MPSPTQEEREDRTPRAAYEQGVKAYRRGESVEDNPYIQHPIYSDLAPRWRDGFIDERDTQNQ